MFIASSPQILEDVITTPNDISTAGCAPATAAKHATQNKDNIFSPFLLSNRFLLHLQAVRVSVSILQQITRRITDWK